MLSALIVPAVIIVAQSAALLALIAHRDPVFRRIITGADWREARRARRLADYYRETNQLGSRGMGF